MKAPGWKHSGIGRPGGLLRHARDARRRGITLVVAMLAALVGIVTALALAELVVKSHTQSQWQARRSAALVSAMAGLERAKLVLAATPPQEGAPVSFAGALTNGDTYSVVATRDASGQTNIVSTGISGATTCILRRRSTGGAGSGRHAVNYSGTYVIKHPAQVDAMAGREPTQSDTRPDLPDFDYYRQLAIAEGNYYTGDKTFTNKTPLSPGVHFAEGNLTVRNRTSADNVTLVAMGNITTENNTGMETSAWGRPVIMAGGNVSISNSVYVQGVVYAGGSVAVSNNVDVFGRLDGASVSLANSTHIYDNGVSAIYGDLEGFIPQYNSGAGGPLTVSGWAEEY